MRMSPEQYVIWLYGVIATVPPGVSPNPDVWAKIVSTNEEVIGGIVKKRLEIDPGLGSLPSVWYGSGISTTNHTITPDRCAAARFRGGDVT